MQYLFKSVASQPMNQILPEKLTTNKHGRIWKHRMVHPILSKSDLLTHFDLTDYRALLGLAKGKNDLGLGKL